MRNGIGELEKLGWNWCVGWDTLDNPDGLYYCRIWKEMSPALQKLSGKRKGMYWKEERKFVYDVGKTIDEAVAGCLRKFHEL